jgi:hypothetical protein
MILIRDVFRLKFGKTRDALAAFKDISDQATRTGYGAGGMRILTDLVGPYYTLVLETTAENLAAYEQQARQIMGDPDWRQRYEKFTPHVESGYREIFNIVQ